MTIVGSFEGGCLKIQTSEQKQHSIVRCDKGAKGHGTVVFAVVTTVPCSGSNFSEELKSLPERWNVVTICCFETATTSITYGREATSGICTRSTFGNTKCEIQNEKYESDVWHQAVGVRHKA